MASEWQNIETAPKDGTSILVYDAATEFGQRWDIAWMAGGWRSIRGGLINTPTHWMPLQSPPVTP
jgi:hypothetical protein